MKTLILLSGKSQSGKNTLANFLIDAFKNKGMSIKQEAFANGVKECCKQDFQALVDYLNNFAEKLKAQIGALIDFNNKYNVNNAYMISIVNLIDKLKIDPNTNWFENKTDITRIILQLYGTEIFRKRVNTDWWANQLKKTWIANNNAFTIVTDCRFPNEIEVFNNLDTNKYKIITIRIQRDLDINKTLYNHPSETALDQWDSWDYIIENNSTLENLKNSATLIVNDILSNLSKEKEYEKNYLLIDNPIHFNIASC